MTLPVGELNFAHLRLQDLQQASNDLLVADSNNLLTNNFDLKAVTVELA